MERGRNLFQRPGKTQKVLMAEALSHERHIVQQLTWGSDTPPLILPQNLLSRSTKQQCIICVLVQARPNELNYKSE